MFLDKNDNNVHQDRIVTENNPVRNSKDSEEGVGELKEKKQPKGPLAIDHGLLLWCNFGLTST